jgi:hypothetical protein
MVVNRIVIGGGLQTNKKAQLNELGFSLSGTGGRTRTATPFGKGF